MKLNIVTICYQDLKGLRATFESIRHLIDDERVEWIVVDGGSTDGTREFMESLSAKKFIYGMDSGIYNAMNIAMGYCGSDDWIWFLNSGDSMDRDLCPLDILDGVGDEVRLVYGRHRKRGSLQPSRPVELLHIGDMPFCHQACFFRNVCCYNENYTIFSDLDFILRIYTDDKRALHKVDDVICNYEGGGISDRVSFRKRKERVEIVFNYYGAMGVVKLVSHALWKKWWEIS